MCLKSSESFESRRALAKDNEEVVLSYSNAKRKVAAASEVA
jgi:hypothetical protein